MSVIGAGRQHEELTVAGLGVTQWPGGASTVVGLPGLTSTAAAWAYLAAQVTGCTVVAPDLRGRGRSFDVPGAPGLAGHADDVARILDELDLKDVVLIGHSMGAYLAPLVENRARHRIRSIVMVDGGIRPALPPFFRPALVRMQFRRQLRSGDRDWPSVEAIADHNKFDLMIKSRPDLREPALAMLAAELRGEPGRLRPAIRTEIAVEDAVNTFFSTDVTAALAGCQAPLRALLASHRRKDGEGPFISEKAVARGKALQPNLAVERLPGNHLTILFAPELAQAVTS